MNRREFVRLAAIAAAAQKLLPIGSPLFAQTVDCAFPQNVYPIAAVQKIIAVEGVLAPTDLGMILPHEHLLLFHAPGNPALSNYSCPPSASPPTCALSEPNVHDCISRATTELQVFGDVQQPSILPNGQLRAVVEVSSRGLRWENATTPKFPNYPDALLQVSLPTANVHVIMGTSYYKQGWYPPDKPAGIEAMEAVIVGDIVVGTPSADGSRIVRAGVIGEVGMSGTDDTLDQPAEERVLLASALAQLKTGTGLIIHFELGPISTQAVRLRGIDICKAAGVDPARIVVGHNHVDLRNNLDLLDRGVMIAFDTLGTECDSGNPHDVWNSAYEVEREQVHALVTADAGYPHSSYVNRILLSQDLYADRFLSYPPDPSGNHDGAGYGFLLKHILPLWIAAPSEGVSVADVITMVRTNPRNLLTINYLTATQMAGWDNDTHPAPIIPNNAPSFPGPSWAPANGVRFNGSPSSYGTVALGDYLPASRPFTVTFWLYAEQFPQVDGAYVTVLDQSHGAGTFLHFSELTSGWTIQIVPPSATAANAPGCLQFAVGTGTTFEYVFSAPIPLNTYCRVTAAYTGCGIKLSIAAGTPSSKLFAAVPLNSAQKIGNEEPKLRPFYVGKWSGSDTRYLKGAVGGLTFYGRALTDPEIAALPHS
jgi:phosphotriesterase-related protein